MWNTAFKLYNAGWHLALPLLKIEPRLKDGYAARRFTERPKGQADIWIQAASAGEAYLAVSLIKSLPQDRKISILISTNTRQGMEILEKAVNELTGRASQLDINLTFFPFDQPAIMDAAVQHINPRVMVLLESEMWPGHLLALRRHNCQILIINGRMTAKSLKGYQLLPKLWKLLAPDRVLAMSGDDADRFAALFGRERVEIMPSIKFDSVMVDEAFLENARRLQQLLPPETDFLVFGSVRQKEESDILKMIEVIGKRFPDLVIGLFPRHMHRLSAWKRYLEKSGRNWACRSALADVPTRSGTIILWDTFGELNAAYNSARAVFVGGSLAPLGGQNFLEPLISGVVPVIGPSWENFAWVGSGLFVDGLVCKTQDWQTATEELIKQLEDPMPRDVVQKMAADYIRERQGGTEQACQKILKALDEDILEEVPASH